MSSVSVVIPCYRYGHFLEQAVSSVLDDQPGVDVRVLIIDDASPDDSGELAEKIAAGDPRIDVVVHATNKGNIATFNEGLLEWADGDYTLLAWHEKLGTQEQKVTIAEKESKDITFTFKAPADGGAAASD